MRATMERGGHTVKMSPTRWIAIFSNKNSLLGKNQQLR